MDVGPRSPQIFEALLARRQLLLQGDVDGDIQDKLTRYILYLNSIGDTPITLFIDTPGGNTEFSLCISDMIRHSNSDVHGVVTCDAFSAGFRILQACRRRIAYPNARLMFHATALNGVRCDSDRWDEACKRAFILHDDQVKLYVARTGQPEAQIRLWAKNEKRFTAQEALQLGFLDAIAEPSKPAW